MAHRLHPDLAERRARHELHAGSVLVAECWDCNSPEAIRARRRARREAREAKRWHPSALDQLHPEELTR